MERLNTVLADLVPEHLDSIAAIQSSVAAVYQVFVSTTGTTRPSSINFYYYYPFLFSEAFPEVDETLLRALSVAGVLYLDHICILDSIVDNPSDAFVHRPFVSSFLHEQSLLLLSRIFNPASPFWQLLNGYQLEFTAALLEEHRYHKNRYFPYAAGKWLTVAKGKSAVSKGTTAAMALLSGRLDSLECFSESQDCFNVAMQIYDDVRDWRGDLSRGAYTPLLNQAIECAKLQSHTAESINASHEIIGHHLYYSGIVDASLDIAIDYCTRAIDRLGAHSVPRWISLNTMLRTQIATLKSDLAEMGTRTQLRARGFLSKGTEQLAMLAMNYILSEQDRGYPEAAHGMLFPARGPSLGSQLHAGCVFQRAIVVDVLQDLNEYELLADSMRITSDIEELIAARLLTVRGGWSYFPTLSDLPPDADDLGQILQVLVRSNHQSISSLVDDPLILLFDKGLHADGSFETWIVDPDASDAVTLDMIKSIDKSWGKGADVEVVANLAYGLILYGRRFMEHVDRAVAFVEGQQDAAGFWIPNWYATRLYGTYVSMRLIASWRKQSPTLVRATEYLHSSQRADGGYGDIRSTPLETALALLCWSTLPPEYAIGGEVARRRALTYLTLTAGEDGAWSATNFIRMDLNRVGRNSPGYRPRELHYKSRTLTTAYVLKALIKNRDLAE